MPMLISDQTALLQIRCEKSTTLSLPQGVTMNPPKPNPVIVPSKEQDSAAPRLRNIVRKSALLNVVIILTSFPVLVYAGGTRAVIPTLKIMAGISLVIWSATFALFSLVIFPLIFQTPVSTVNRSDSLYSENETGVDDRWVDGPG
jgi:hypothetical protein